MGLYDVLVDKGRSAQVKCWESELDTYNIGDEVPALDGRRSYNIVLREGGYAQVVDGTFLGIFEEPLKGYPIADKYGDWHSTDSAKEFYASYSDPLSIASLLAQAEEEEHP